MRVRRSDERESEREERAIAKLLLVLTLEMALIDESGEWKI